MKVCAKRMSNYLRIKMNNPTQISFEEKENQCYSILLTNEKYVPNTSSKRYPLKEMKKVK